MKKSFLNIFKTVFFTCISLFVLSGCSPTEKPLHGVYFGYYDHSDDKQFILLAFDKNHPKEVAVKQKTQNISMDSLSPIQYSSSVVTIATNHGAVDLKISKDEKILICSSCDGVNAPKTYELYIYNGKVVDPKITFDAIEMDAKYNDGHN